MGTGKSEEENQNGKNKLALKKIFDKVLIVVMDLSCFKSYELLENPTSFSEDGNQ